MNKVIFTGRLCADPELRQTQSGISVCRFRIAVNRPYSKDSEQKADFISCTAWRQSAEFVSKYFSKGSAIIVEGSLHNADYTDNNGVKHYGMDVQVSNVEFGESKKASDSNSGSYNNAGTYNNSGNYSNAGNNYQNYQQQPQRQQPPQQQYQTTNMDLNGFEEILNDGECPF